MEDTFHTIFDDTSKPVWENRVESPISDYVPASIPMGKYKLKLKYGGFFRLVKNTCKKIYCFGSQKCIHIDTWSYNLSQLNKEVIKRYSSKNNSKLSISYDDKCASGQSFIELDSDEKFMAILNMYEKRNKITTTHVTPRILIAKKVKETLNLRGTRRVEGRTRREEEGVGILEASGSGFGSEVWEAFQSIGRYQFFATLRGK
uniref:Uncharacterized protein n=1 Tax=Lactuca sativa TaxID=4236 RepID=A0A9R1VCK4_LACSA|nr:hypothetical protein LSAT_V11C600335630 [Lactuca sativa]